MRTLFYPECGPMPYESILSIYLKLSHSNFIELADLRRNLGGLWTNGESGRLLINYKIEECLEREIHEIAHHLPWKYAPAIALSSPASALRFCAECVKFGYHSVFNSIQFHRMCPLHKRALSLACVTCRQRFLKGFTTCQTIPNTIGICSTCGFQDMGLRDEIKKRRAPGLAIALEHFGRAQARWYQEIYSFHAREPGYSELYYQSELGRAELSGPCERFFNMHSPEKLSGRQYISPPITCVGSFRTYLHCRLYMAASRFALGDHLRLHSQIEILIRVKERYLGKHADCCRDMCKIADYPDGKLVIRPMCSVATAYILLCMKARYNVWPSPGSICQDFSLLASLGSSAPSFVSCWTYREAVLVFFTILARLEYYVSEGANFFVICRSETVYFPSRRGLTVLRKASYKFRFSCRIPSEKLLIARDGLGGALMIICTPQRDHADPHSKLKTLVV